MRKGLFWLNDKQWARIQPHLPTNQTGPVRDDDRRIISGIVHMLQCGARWRDCSPDYGPYTTITTLALANMLSELRKYRVGFTIAHQYLQQLSPEIRHSILGNVGTIISFRVGTDDAPQIAEEFHNDFDLMDLLRLENHHIYLKLMLDGMPTWPFSARTLPSFNG
jgi:hypothetical protein